MTISPASSPADRGVIYVAVGKRYLDESAFSAASLRKTNPGLPVYLLTDTPPEDPSLWDKIIHIDATLPGSAMKLHMDQAPWARCLFIDSDTMVVGSLDPLFALLDRFELAAMQHSGGGHYTIPGLPSSFPEFNSGVIAWRRNERVSAFFARWRELYAQMLEPTGRTWDQKSFRVALYESDLRIISIPHGYNLMTYFPSVVEGYAVILHGRSADNLQRLAVRIAQSTMLRAYVPGVGVMRHPKDMPWSALLSAIFRMVAWKLRACFSNLRRPSA
ncbi:MAG: hypothetical protein WC661_02575 [Opitutaceae bacterium]|jgi:hypothetical protein